MPNSGPTKPADLYRNKQWNYLGVGDKVASDCWEVSMQIATLLFPVHDGKVYLAKPKRGHHPGFGLYNGYGGKMRPEDRGDVRRTACREYSEEARATCWPEDLELVAVVDFFKEGEYKFECHIFFTSTFGAPQETGEMSEAHLFPIDEVPYDQMMSADVVWLMPVFKGARFHAECHYSAGNQKLLRFTCKPLAP